MRRLAFFSSVTLVFLGGCVLVGTYKYDDYEDKPAGAGGNDSVSSSNGGGGLVGSGGMGGTAGMGGSAGAGGTGGSGGQLAPCLPGALDGGFPEGGIVDGGPVTLTEVCNNGFDDDCAGDGDCSVLAAFSDRYGNDAEQKVLDIATTSNDGVAVAGAFVSNISFNGSMLSNATPFLQPFAVKLDKMGNAAFAYKIDASGTANGITAQANDTFITGNLVFPMDFSMGQIFIQKIGANGSMAWEVKFGANAINAGVAIGTTAVIGAPVFVTGVMAGAIDIKSTCMNTFLPYDALDKPQTFLLKLAPGSTYDCRWSKTIGNAVVTSMAVTTKTVVIAGSYSQTLNWPGAAPVAPMSNSTASFIGSYDPVSNQFQWAKFITPNTGGSVNFQSVTADDEGNAYAVGTFKGTVTIGNKTLTSGNSGIDSDMLVVAFDAMNSGNPLWSARFGGTGPQIPSSIRATGTAKNMGIYVSGTTSAGMAIDDGLETGPLCQIGSCAFLLKLRPVDGKTIWARAFGGTEKISAANMRLAIDSLNLWMAGSWSGDMAFDSMPLPTTGAGANLDVVIGRFSPLP